MKKGKKLVRFKFNFRPFILLLLLFLGIGMTISFLNAQYFGRNKVQYETFNFKVMKTKHFDIYFYPEKQEAAMHAARMAERWYARLSRLLNHDLRGRQPLILYASSPDFQQTSAIPGILGEGTGGVTEMLKRRIILPLGASMAESDHVIGHELVHAFQFDITSQAYPRYASAAPTALRLPLFRMLGIGRGYYGIFPADFIAFFDMGVAWWNDDEIYDNFGVLVEDSRNAWFLGGGRRQVSSAGIGLRTNLFGYFILGLDYVYPFQRPKKGWYFQFTFTPGF